jgi:hypothetical protein
MPEGPDRSLRSGLARCPIPAAGGAASALMVDSGTRLYQLVSVGSVVLWDCTAAKQMFSDLSGDKALPESLVTGSSVRGAA